MRLKGIIGDDQLPCVENEREDGHRCRHCWNIITSFPPELVLGNIPFLYEGSLCLSYSQRIEALATRHDNPLRFQSQENITKCFLLTAEAMFESVYMHYGCDSGTNHSFLERMKSQGGNIEEVDDGFFVEFHFMSGSAMEALKKMATAIRPSVMSSIPKSSLLSFLHPLGKATKNGTKRVLVRQLFETLVQLGFDLASKDYALIDPLEERALQSYHALFRSEEEAS